MLHADMPSPLLPFVALLLLYDSCSSMHARQSSIPFKKMQKMLVSVVSVARQPKPEATIVETTNSDNAVICICCLDLFHATRSSKWQYKCLLRSRQQLG